MTVSCGKGAENRIESYYKDECTADAQQLTLYAECLWSDKGKAEVFSEDVRILRIQMPKCTRNNWSGFQDLVRNVMRAHLYARSVPLRSTRRSLRSG